MDKQTRIIPLDEIRSRDFLPGEIGCGYFEYSGKEGEKLQSAVRWYMHEDRVIYFFWSDLLKILDTIMDPSSTEGLAYKAFCEAHDNQEPDTMDDLYFGGPWVGPTVSLASHGDSSKEPVSFRTLDEYGIFVALTDIRKELCFEKSIDRTAMLLLISELTLWLRSTLSAIRKTGEYTGNSSLKTIHDLMAFMDLVHEQITENFQKQDLRIEAEREDLSKQIELATDNIIRLKDEVQALKETSNVIKDQTTALGSKVFDSVMPMINTPPEEDQEVVYEEPKPNNPWTEEDYDKFRMYFAQTAHILGQPLKVWMSTIWTLIKMEFKYCPRDIKISGIGYKAFCKAHEQDPDTYPGDMSSLIKVMDDYVFCKDDSVSPITSTFVWQQGKELYNKLYKRRNIYRKKTDAKSKASEDAVAKQKELLLSDYQNYSDFVEEHKVCSMPRVAVTVSGDVVTESLADNVDSLFSFSFTGVGGRSCSEEDAM